MRINLIDYLIEWQADSLRCYMAVKALIEQLGHRLDEDGYITAMYRYYCSTCEGKRFYLEVDPDKHPYCPHCGGDRTLMDGE